ncbi:MAG TPA: PIG-L deacetylase family protein [Vicinamibacterales bacterium]|jgi:LmbE family N-acetylglucosaminyl deacetylase|nr:PIG-L deacetylase family protein [Vicinamibacterales bacterium]
MALRLMCVLAHPDDESLGTGGTLARYAAEGVETYLVTATRGENGRFGDSGERPAPEVVGATREAELRAAAQELGIREVTLLGFPDGGLDAVDPLQAQDAIVSHFRRIKPHVVITFGPEGAYGHPDHIAISQLTTAAAVRAARSDHAVSKLYYIAWGVATWAAYQAALKKLVTTVDGVEREVVPAPDWEITTRIDASAVWPTVLRAVQCHRTQVSIFKKLEALPEEQQRTLWGVQEYYRAFSLVNGGRTRETDLFEGLR